MGFVLAWERIILQLLNGFLLAWGADDFAAVDSSLNIRSPISVVVAVVLLDADGFPLRRSCHALRTLLTPTHTHA